MILDDESEFGVKSSPIDLKFLFLTYFALLNTKLRTSYSRNTRNFVVFNLNCFYL
jgi:hypothetical protein